MRRLGDLVNISTLVQTKGGFENFRKVFINVEECLFFYLTDLLIHKAINQNKQT